MEYGSAGSANGAAASKDEDEVDVLTSLLVQSMDNAVDPEFFGTWTFKAAFPQFFSFQFS